MNYRLIRAHKRTLSLQVNRAGEVIARAPFLMPKFLIDNFVTAKKGWITKQQKAVLSPKPMPTSYFTLPELESYIRHEVTKYSRVMQLYPEKVRFTTVRSFWGTCSPRGVISFNLALRCAPAEVVTYVIIHELAHLKYRGHGQRFWALVTAHCPQVKLRRAYLKSTIAVGNDRPGPVL